MTITTSHIVLDASALIASIYEEKGCEHVEPYLENAIISAVNFAEVASYLVRQDCAFETVDELLQDLALTVIDYDAPQALATAKLIKKTSAKGLSLGDRSCLALALSRNLPVLTADRVWKTLALGIEVKVIR